MNEKKTQCNKATDGVHQFVLETAVGREICKLCGDIRDVDESPQPSPLSVAEIMFGADADTHSFGVIQGKQEDRSHKDIPESLFQEVLATTRSRAAIIVTFDDMLLGSPFRVDKFHISVVNVEFKNIKNIFHLLIEALSGRLGGNMNIRKTGGDDPAPTGV